MQRSDTLYRHYHICGHYGAAIRERINRDKIRIRFENGSYTIDIYDCMDIQTVYLHNRQYKSPQTVNIGLVMKLWYFGIRLLLVVFSVSIVVDFEQTESKTDQSIIETTWKIF